MFEDYRLLEALMYTTWTLFAFAFGACLGSLINVLVYRLPLGLDVVTPSSKCPSCQTQLTWRENIPVLGWLLLRGRCRFCKARISPEYPIVEAFVGGVFALLYVLWFVLPLLGWGQDWLGVEWREVVPEWTRNGFGRMWPTYVLTVLLIGSLVAMTIIDARTFQIPLVLTYVPMALGVVAHTGHALWIQLSQTGLRSAPEGDWWVIPTAGPRGWWLLGLGVGACAGLLISAGLQKLGVLKQSYGDYEEWEASLDLPETDDTDEDAAEGPARPWRRTLAAAAMLVAGVGGGLIATIAGWPTWLVGLGSGLVALPVFGVATAPRGTAPPPTEAEVWLQYPHARREAIRELIWVSPAIALGLLGAWLGLSHAQDVIDPVTGLATASPSMPLWLSVLGGSVSGLVVGGGLVWGIRILGSLAFGKEAMGLGDVWLMAAVGACLGWMDSALIFFVAPFVAIYLTVVLAAWSGAARRALPYGPSLAAATVIVIVAERGFERLFGAIWNLPGPLVLP